MISVSGSFESPPPDRSCGKQLPDPIAVIQAVSFEGADAAELATAIRVLQAATARLNDHLSRLPLQPVPQALVLAERT